MTDRAATNFLKLEQRRILRRIAQPGSVDIGHDQFLQVGLRGISALFVEVEAAMLPDIVEAAARSLAKLCPLTENRQLLVFAHRSVADSLINSDFADFHCITGVDWCAFAPLVVVLKSLTNCRAPSKVNSGI
jgi:hypothetical protein